MVITRCPDCHARFRVTDGQLKLARGQVRCGACLCVFDARQHAQPDIEDSKPTAQPTSADSTETTGATSAGSVAAAATNGSNTTLRTAESDVQPTRPVQSAQAQPFARSAEPSQDAPTAMPGEQDPKGFRAEPIAFQSRDRDRDDNPVATTGWMLLSLIAILALAGQVLWFERARLAVYSELSSVYALICDQVDCSLKQNALTLIDNQGLHLQPHPKYSDALTAAIVLENRAAFSQPWPGLQLSFTDLKGRAVARRTFQPEEYLDTRSVDPLRMPQGQPMQIELELASPGRRGVSYELRLVPAQLSTAK